MRPKQRSVRLSRLPFHVLTTLLCLSTIGITNHASARQRPTEASAPQASPADPLVVVVSLRRQRLTVFNKNGAVTASPVSSGQPEFPTPTGVFSVIGKEIEHESNIYEGAAMPFMQRLTWTGTAMHAGNLPGYAASHGCVRLPYNFSQKLFSMTQINTRVIVTRDDVAPQSIAHANLFAPLIEPTPPAEQTPMANAVVSRVASIDGIGPSIAPIVVIPPNVLPLTTKAKARFAETAKLFDQIKPAEASRSAVWENVKAANRALEAVKADINSLQSVVDDAQVQTNKLKRSKASAEAQLAMVMRKAENATSPETIDASGKAEDAAEARLLDIVSKLDAETEKVDTLKSALPSLKARLQAAESARRALDDSLKSSNQALKDAQGAYALAKREDARYAKPVSVLVSRKDQRLYVRQGFEPVLEVPITIADPDHPLGTHVFTAMGLKSGRTLEWQVVSLSAPRTKKSESRGSVSASKALDRLSFPPEALAAITELVKPGSSLIVSDETNSQYFGNGTDFTVAIH